jgi:hypothetical protein
MNEQEAEAVAKALKGRTWQSGGDISGYDRTKIDQEPALAGIAALSSSMRQKCG